MTQILFIQGAGAGTHDEWDNKLVDSLRRELGAGYDIRYPRMPDEDSPTYAAWKTAIERELESLDPGAIVVGHSVGGAMLINVIAHLARPARLGAIVLLAAPFIGQGGWDGGDEPDMNDIGEALHRGTPVLLYHGDDDDTVPPAHLGIYVASIEWAAATVLSDRDHQLNDDLSETARDIKALVRQSKA